MKQFFMRMNLFTYQTFDEYLEAEKLGENDFICTTEAIYDNFIEKRNLPAKSICVESFGRGEPTTDMMDNMLAEIPEGTKRIIAIGGGSVLDVSKVLALDLKGTTEELFLGEAEYKKVREVVAIPTTCGTGSEVTNAVAAELVQRKTKRGLSLMEFYPDSAVLIPELLKGLPYPVFATSSIDALIHAIESFLSPKASAHSEMFSISAIKTILAGYQNVVENGKDSWKNDIEDYLVASNFAGIAFANAGCAAVHAMSYPLGGQYHIPHGEANQLMLPEVLRKYKEKQPVGRINDFEALLSDILGVSTDKSIEELIKLVDNILARKPLKDYGMTLEEFPAMAAGVIENQQRLLVNNYTELTVEDLVSIYEASF